MTNGIIVTIDRCSHCETPAAGGQFVGAECNQCKIPGSTDHSTATIVRILECGRRSVEISAAAPDYDPEDGVLTYGFVGTKLSREFGHSSYATIKNAERAARRWLEKHNKTDS